MLTMREVTLKKSIEKIVSRPGMRVNCDVCGEEIMNEREVHQHGLTLCLPCAQGAYYQAEQSGILRMTQVAEL